MLILLKDLGTKKVGNSSRRWVEVKCSRCNTNWIKTKNDYNKNPEGFCAKCAKELRAKDTFNKAKESFIEKAQKIHGNTYDYSQSIYTGAKNLLDIKCPIHGNFSMRPNNHISGKQGCPICGKENMALMQSEKARGSFIARSKQVHGNKYGYDNVQYKNAHSKINITCISHGEFRQRPADHLNGHGCPKCTDLSDYDALYIWRVNNSCTFKIGVTSARLNNKRIKEVSSALAKANTMEVTPVIEVLVHANNALEIEKELHMKFTKCDETIKNTFSGYSEFRILTEDELQEALTIVHKLRKNDIPRSI